jgi:hypothetical protein
VTNGAPGDLLVVQGNLAIQPNSTIAISILGSTLQVGTSTLITYAGTKTGSFNPTVVVTGGTFNGSLTIDESTPGQINLVVIPQVAITSQPADVIVSTNQNATFTVVATGVSPLFYQWYRYADNTGSSPVGQNGATNSSFTITNCQGSDSGFYGVVVSNAYNAVTSRFASLLVGDVLPVLSGPTNKTVIAGNSVTFSTTVIIANPPAALQWQTNSVNVAGATSTSLTLTGVPFAFDGMTVTVIATNNAGTVTSNATLSVIVTPVITPQPVSVTTNAGNMVVFTSGATGVPTPGLQWSKNGTPIPGETGSTLTIASVQGSDNGNYTLTATNAAGSATSSKATLTVVSTALAATAFAPANGATGVCYDTPLYVTFNSPPAIINTGKIRIFNVNNPATPVDIIDMSSNSVFVSPGILLTNNVQARSAFAGDSQAFNYFPIIITGTTAAIYPHSGVLTSNQTYYVTMDSGEVGEPGGAYFSGITATNVWKFTTKVAGPLDTNNPVVAADGSGDFVTVQAAVDSLPVSSPARRVVSIHDGNYVEIVDVSKTNITFRGQSRAGTVVGYGNNATIAPAGTTHARMAFKVNANDIAIENLTITNRTPVGGSQAEALMIESAMTRFICNNANIASYQDTILANQNNSAGYFYNSLVQGQFDYIWGGGRLFFTNCETMTLVGVNGTLNTGNLTASRTDLAGTNGLDFIYCKMTRITNTIINTTVASGNGTANGNVALVSCNFDDNYTNPSASAIALPVILWEFGNSNLNNTLPRTFGGIVLTEGDGRLIAARTASLWLNGWIPQLAPNILTNPVSQTVAYAAPASFTVAATGIPDPTYQWVKDGTNLTGATSATVNIPSATAIDGGSYSVVVTTPAGSVTSSPAVLTVTPPSNTAPVFTAPISGTNFTINVGVNLAVACPATDSDMPAQTLTYSLLVGPMGAAVNSGNGNFTWRPTVPQGGSMNNVSVVVTDNGTPNLSATNSFTVTVNTLTQPTANSPAYAGGLFSVNVTGQVGPDYALQATTNLVGGTWTTVATTNSPATVPFSLTDTNAAAQPVQFYRIVTGPPLP